MDATTEQQHRAHVYARARRRVMFVGWGLSALYLGAWLGTGAGPALRDALSARVAAPGLLVAGFGVAFAVPYELATVPLAIYGGFLLPHRFGQSRQTFAQWCVDVLKGWAVGGVLGLGLLEGLYAILRRQPDRWWVWAAGGVLGFNIIATHLGPVLVFPLFFRFTPLADPDLRARLLRLCEKAGTRVRGVFTFDLGRKTRGANAALAGLGATRRILLSDTLCDGYTPAEVEVVLAHELGHHVHRHLWKGLLAGAAGTLLFFRIADAALRAWLPAVGVAHPADVAGLPLLLLVLGVLGVVTMPIGHALSRHFERQADAVALRFASEPAAMITTMEKLADHNLADREPHPLVTWWFHSHPPINRRIATAEAYLAKAGGLDGERGPSYNG